MKSISKLLLYSLCLFVFAACANKESKMIEAQVDELNKICPKQIDIFTTLERAEFKSPKTIQYYYTLTINKFDTNLEELKDGFKQNLGYNILYNDKLNGLKDAGVTFQYICYDQDAKYLFELTFDPDFYSLKVTESGENSASVNVFQILQQSASIQNQQLPRSVNEGIDMYEVKAVSPSTLEFVYRFSTSDRSEIDTAYLVSKRLKTELVNGLKNNPNEDKMLKDNGVTFRFTYCDKEGVPISSIEVTPQEYQ